MNNTFWATVGIIWLIGIIILVVAAYYILTQIDWNKVFGEPDPDNLETDYNVSDYGLNYSMTIFKRENNVTCLSQHDAYDRFYDGKGDCWVKKK